MSYHTHRNAVADQIRTAVMYMSPDPILANTAFLMFLPIRLYKLNPVAGVITYLACGMLSLVLGCLTFIWTPRDLILTEVSLAPSIVFKDDVTIVMLTWDSNGYLRAAEAEDEKGPSAVWVVGWPTPASAYSALSFQRHKLRTYYEWHTHEATSPGGWALHFQVCTFYSYIVA